MIRACWSIFAREYLGFFRTPLGWVVVAVFAALSGFVFARQTLMPGEVASMRGFFQVWWALLMVVAPAVSMRLVSDELRAGTLEPLLATPAPDGVVIAGKYFAGLAFVATMLAPTLLYVLLLLRFGDPELGPIIAGYLGLLALAMVYLAVGTLISTFTASGSLAFLATFIALLAAEVVSRVVAPVAPEWAREALFALSVNDRMADFAKGLIVLEHVVFFIAVSVWLLILATLSLQSRRWR